MSYPVPINWGPNLRTLQEVGVVVSPAVTEAVAAKAALIEATHAFHDKTAERISEISSATTTADDELYETALRLAAERELPNASELRQGVAEQRALLAMRQHAEDLSTQLAEIVRNDGCLEAIADAAMVYTHDMNPSQLLNGDRAAFDAYRNVREAGTKLTSVYMPLRGWLGETSGQELRDTQVCWYLQASDEKVTSDEIARLKELIANPGMWAENMGSAPMAQIIAEAGHPLTFNSISGTAEVMRAADKRQVEINKQAEAEARAAWSNGNRPIDVAALHRARVPTQ